MLTSKTRSGRLSGSVGLRTLVAGVWDGGMACGLGLWTFFLQESVVIGSPKPETRLRSLSDNGSH